MNQQKRNERTKTGQLQDSGRRYWYDVPGRQGWKARYVKEVNESEETVRFYQQIYDQDGQLVEVHQKYPEDTGHQRVGKE